jgi:hypothetical protein
MLFDPENSINKLCAKGMQLEGEGKPEEAAKLFYLAWEEANNNEEKFIAAHYVARHQNTMADKLKWDTIALSFAMQIDSPDIKSVYPSLYLNIAKCFDDLGESTKAKENYNQALNYSQYLTSDGYGKMILSGINKGLEQLEKKEQTNRCP